jgi:hypothetical protein
MNDTLWDALSVNVRAFQSDVRLAGGLVHSPTVTELWLSVTGTPWLVVRRLSFIKAGLT